MRAIGDHEARERVATGLLRRGGRVLHLADAHVLRLVRSALPG